jgi:DNA-binding NtrC family response regulator
MYSFSKLREMRTLLIDDDAMIRDALSLAFRNKACYLHAIETGEDGLQALDHGHFDIIISDFNLPGIDGLEFFKLAALSHPDTIRILITACWDNSISPLAFGLGVHYFIEKPFSVQTLVESLETVIEEKKGKRIIAV